MMETIYYYCTVSGTAIFSNGNVKEEGRVGQYLRMLIYAKKDVQKLNLNKPEDFEKIRSMFFSDEYWRNRTPEDEYNEKPTYL